GFVYRGNKVPGLKGKLLFADITTGHVWYSEMKDVLSADDGNPTTLAVMHELDAGLRSLVEQTFHARGGNGDTLPGAGAVSGRGRVDVRFAEDANGELYVLTKSDGMIRQGVGIRCSGRLVGCQALNHERRGDFDGRLLLQPDIPEADSAHPVLLDL